MNTNGDQLAETGLMRDKLDAVLAYMLELGFNDDQITEIVWARLDAIHEAARHPPSMVEPAE